MARAIHLRLYIAGSSARSTLALRRVQDFCKQLPEGSCQLEVLDLFEHEDLAERERIIATPLLRRVQPPPVVHVVGDMGDEGQLAALLGPMEEPRFKM